VPVWRDGLRNGSERQIGRSAIPGTRNTCFAIFMRFGLWRRWINKCLQNNTPSSCGSSGLFSCRPSLSFSSSESIRVGRFCQKRRLEGAPDRPYSRVMEKRDRRANGCFGETALPPYRGPQSSLKVVLFRARRRLTAQTERRLVCLCPLSLCGGGVSSRRSLARDCRGARRGRGRLQSRWR